MKVKDLISIDNNCKIIISILDKKNIVASEWTSDWVEDNKKYEDFRVKKILIEPLDCGIDINMYIII